MRSKVEKIAVLTSGGDAPGMNAAIRAVVRSAIGRGVRVYGVVKGFEGLFEDDVREMYAESVSNIINRGGTMLQTARCKRMLTDEGRDTAAAYLKEKEFDALVVIGGDGSYKGALELAKRGINVIGIPGTIDLDIGCTEYSIGYGTAVNTAMEAIDKIKDTSASHERCSIVEVMGRTAGYIALSAGISTGAEAIILPETYDYDEEKIIENLTDNKKRGHLQQIIINAEGIGDSVEMAKRIEAATGIETRATILGYLQRGGSPNARDRIVASVMGAMAVELLCGGAKNRIIAIQRGRCVDLDIKEALAIKKELPKYLVDVANVLTYHYTKRNSI